MGATPLKEGNAEKEGFRNSFVAPILASGCRKAEARVNGGIHLTGEVKVVGVLIR